MCVTLPTCAASTAVCCPSSVSGFTVNLMMGMCLSSCRATVESSVCFPSYSLFEKKFVAGYQFMKVERNGADTFYRIDWKDVVLILENPVVKILKVR